MDLHANSIGIAFSLFFFLSSFRPISVIKAVRY